MEAFFSLLLVKSRTGQDDILAVGNVAGQHRNDAHLARGIVVNGHHVEIVVNLQVRILEEIIQDGLLICVLLQLDGNSQTITVRFIPHFCNAWHLVVDTDVINFLDQDSLIDLVGNLSDNNLFLATFQILNLCPRTDHHAPFPCLIGLANLIATLDDRSRREIRPWQKFHELIQFGRWMINHVDNRINDLS